MNGNLLALGSVAALALGAAARSRAGCSRDHAVSAGSRNHALSPARRDAFEVLARNFVAQLPRLIRPADGSWYEQTASPMSRLRRDAARAWGDERGLRYLGHGRQRTVFAVSEGVLKIEDPSWMRSNDATPSNIVEAGVWRDAPSRVRPHLVPVLASAPDGSWLLMEQAMPRTDPQAKGLGMLRDTHPQADKVLSDCGLEDLHEKNLSNDGRVLDYGTIVDPVRWRACLREPVPERQAGSCALRDDLPDPRGVLENPRDPGSTGRVERKIRKTGYGPRIDLVGSVTPRGDRFSSGEVLATRVDDLSLLAPGARAVIARIGERRGSPVERAYVVHTANIEPGGVGWGQVLYQAMAMRAAEENAVLVSHACTPSGITSNDAENMWEKLGRSIVVEPVDTSEDEEEVYDGPCFVAWGESVGSFSRVRGSRAPLPHPPPPHVGCKTSCPYRARPRAGRQGIRDRA